MVESDYAPTNPIMVICNPLRNTTDFLHWQQLWRVERRPNTRLFNPKLQPGPFNPRLFNHELFNPRPFNPEFLNHGVEKSKVEKFGVEMSFTLLERWHFNPGHFSPRLFNHELFIHTVQKFMVKKSGVDMSFNPLKGLVEFQILDHFSPSFLTQKCWLILVHLF